MKRIKQKHGGLIVNAEKGETANRNGRPKKLVSKIIDDLKEEGYEEVRPNHVADAISLLLSLDRERLKALAIDGKQPIIIQRTARRLVGASDKDWDSVLKDNLDRAHGKAKQSIDHTTQGEKMQITGMVIK